MSTAGFGPVVFFSVGRVGIAGGVKYSGILGGTKGFGSNFGFAGTGDSAFLGLGFGL
jgi:hypothetical protein